MIGASDVFDGKLLGRVLIGAGIVESTEDENHCFGWAWRCFRSKVLSPSSGMISLMVGAGGFVEEAIVLFHPSRGLSETDEDVMGGMRTIGLL